MSHPAPTQVEAAEPGGARAAEPSRSRAHGRGLLALGAVVAVTLWFRSPILVNAGSVNSDAAIVGLQARHMLEGEWSPFLWGAGYQSSVEAMIAAALFSVAGATPFALALVPILGHLLATWFAYDVLRRRSSPWMAAVLTTPIVLASMPVTTILLNVARSWSIAAVLASVWLLDGASRSRRPPLRWAAGSFLALVAVYLDLFSLVFLGGLALLALATTFDDAPPAGSWLRRALACAGGAGAGAAALWLVRSSGKASSGVATLTTSRVSGNLQLLLETCLPWVLGTKIFVPTGSLYPTRWAPPAVYAWVPPVAAACVIGLLAVSAFMAVARSRSEWQVSRIGLFGLAVIACTFAAFLLSGMPSDMWAARYLAPAVFAAPFALLPGHRALGRWFAPLLVPFIVSSAVSGWLAHGSATAGPLPVASAQADREVRELRDELRRRGVRHAVAQYWLSYRLSFLFEEDPIVVPLEPAQDRYPPFREAIVAAPVLAFIFHPSEPRAKPEPVASMLQRNGTPFERLSVGAYTVLVARRAAAP